jgi:hypothetical protein
MGARSIKYGIAWARVLAPSRGCRSMAYQCIHIDSIILHNLPACLIMSGQAVLLWCFQVHCFQEPYGSGFFTGTWLTILIVTGISEASCCKMPVHGLRKGTRIGLAVSASWVLIMLVEANMTDQFVFWFLHFPGGLAHGMGRVTP